MKDILTYLQYAVRENASDLFISAGKAVCIKKGDEILPAGDETIDPDQSSSLIHELYRMAERVMDRCLTQGDDDFSVSVSGLARFRVSTYRQRGTLAAVIRVVHFGIPDWNELGIPADIMRMADIPSGLVLVTGPAGSGRSTTLACIVDAINHHRHAHIITIEDPIEYLHRDDKSYITQRELAVDTESYAAALRVCLRQASNVILLEELDSEKTLRLAMMAAESGHLVLSALHTSGVVNTIGHIVDQFPSEQQQPVRIQLAKVLKAVASQYLLAAEDGGLVPAFESIYVDNAVRGFIREGDIQQIDSVIRNFAMPGTFSMDESILRLYKSGRISRETALQFAANVEQFQRKL